MRIHRVSIEDVSGRMATIELRMENRLAGYLAQQGASVSVDLSRGYAEWRALSLNCFGAQRGGMELNRGVGNEEFARSNDLVLRGQMSNGVNQSLLILKRWHTNVGFPTSGTGTLLQGVNPGLRAGAISWEYEDI